jgi:dTDP-4-dehydrorhamnose reductase
VVVGAAGQLGAELVRAFGTDGDDVLPLARPQIDLERPSSLDVITTWRPDIVVNAAAWTDVDGCARDPDRAMRLNGEAAGIVAMVAERARALIVQVSTNYVFDGELDRPYREDDLPAPVDPYGASKLAGETAVQSANPRSLIVRTAWLFSRGSRTFPARIRAAAERAMAAGEPLRVVSDEVGNPTWCADLAQAIADISRRRLQGDPVHLMHIAGWPPVSRYEWAVACLADMRDAIRIEPITLAEYPRPGRVPPRAVLDVELSRSHGVRPSDWHAATARLLRVEGRA